MKRFSVFLIIIIGLLAILAYWIAFKPNFVLDTDNGQQYIYIQKNTTIDSVRNILFDKGYLKDNYTFSLLSKLYRTPSGIKSGAYLITPETSNIKFLNNIYKGRQTPVKLKINNIRLKKQLVSKICKQTDIDSLEMIGLLNDTAFLKSYNLTPHNCLTLFIPNTYEIYWNISSEQLFARMKKEYDKFWNKERKAKAAKIPLNPIEVSILASIVEEETNKAYEKPIIAGLYINRLKIGMKLQADPTARYALNDFTIDQVFYAYTRIDSPYNTYIYQGLPPGPIRIPTAEGIDAVLNYKQHNYLYMCAKPELNGEHNFAENYETHQKYAAQYYKALKEWKAKKANSKK